MVCNQKVFGSNPNRTTKNKIKTRNYERIGGENNIGKIFKDHCKEYNLPFKIEDSVSSYDETTLFCPSGMQQFKDVYLDKTIKDKTICNIQSCIRLNDLDVIGDGTHLLYFNMIGMFSFRHLTLKETIDFWISYINKLGLELDYVTIHPDKIEEWKHLYDGLEIREDNECIWSCDGENWSYCTEFYIDDIEIGNIVNNGGDSIDVGFGYERLDSLVNGTSKNEIEILKETILKLIDNGYYPSSQKQGYVLRKLLTKLVNKNESLDHKFYYKEKERQEKIKIKYERIKDRHKDKPKEWWYDTHGIDLDLLK